MPEDTYHHGDLKAQLIQQGLKLLDTEGYKSFSLRKVARLCGVSQTAPYRHFHSKDELIGAIANHAMEAFAKQLQSAVSLHPDDSNAQLKEMGVAYVRFFAKYPEYLRLLFFSDVQLRARFGAQNKPGSEYDSFNILINVTAKFQQDHPEIPLSHNELVLYSWGLVHGIATLIASGALPNDEATLAQADKVVRGIL